MINPKKNVLLKNYTTVGIGGPANFFYKANTAEKLIEVVLLAKKQKLPFLILGEGSNVLVSDEGFPGLVIKNEMKGIIGFKQILKVGTGTLLSKLVKLTVRQNLGGLQKLAGIPGTVGGAVYGNAGAYGMSISDHITKVIAFDSITEKTISMTKKQCQFDYRDSVFKKNNFKGTCPQAPLTRREAPLIILEVHFKLSKLPREARLALASIRRSGSRSKRALEAEMKEILKQRAAKNYWQGKSPGSFFKNIPVNKVPPKSLKLIPKSETVHGKIPAGYFLEQVGAKNMQIGQIKVSQNHANLIINLGGGTSADFYVLALELAKRVKKKFGISLEPEVQLINLPSLQID